MKGRFAVMEVERDNAKSELAEQKAQCKETRAEKAAEVEVKRQTGNQHQRDAIRSLEKQYRPRDASWQRTRSRQ
jgi:DNA-binding XRE family transcriptional regulator